MFVTVTVRGAKTEKDAALKDAADQAAAAQAAEQARSEAQEKIDSLTAEAEKAAKDAETAAKESAETVRQLTEENEQLKKAANFEELDEEGLTDALIKVAARLEKLGYRLSLTKEDPAE